MAKKSEGRPASSLKERILERLKPLVGLPLSLARRAADMGVLHFGKVKKLSRGSAGEFALHIQCPWRLEGPQGIVTGRADYWELPSAVKKKSPKIAYQNWSYDDANLQDEKLRHLLGGYDETTRSAVNEAGRFVVEGISADDGGGATLALSGGYRLVIFPDGSCGEEWRFFRPESDEDHFVVEHEE